MSHGDAADTRARPGAQIRIQHNDSGTTIWVPARGLVRGGRGFFIFGAVALPAAGAVAWLVLRTGLSVEKVFYGAFAPMVLAVGAAIALRIGLRLGSQRARIEVAGDRLHVRTVTALWPRHRQWHRDQLAAVGVGDVDFGTRGGTGGSSSDWVIRYKQLEITEPRGRTFALLAGWPEEDLQRVARAVAEGLRLAGAASS